MTVTINLVYIIAGWLYALIVTILWISALFGRAKERVDDLFDDHYKLENEKLHFETMSRTQEAELVKLKSEIATHEQNKRTLAEQYIKIQNEYALYRMLVREADPKANARASMSMCRQKGAAGSASCATGNGGSASCATEEAQNG